MMTRCLHTKGTRETYGRENFQSEFQKKRNRNANEKEVTKQVPGDGQIARDWQLGNEIQSSGRPLVKTNQEE